MAQTLLWLDNAKNPYDVNNLDYSPIGKNVTVVWVHNYSEFERYILANGLPEGICFDYDLGEEKNGFDCARFITRYCMNYALPLPKYAFQSDDKSGQMAMELIFERYEHFYDSIKPKVDWHALISDGSDNELPF